MKITLLYPKWTAAYGSFGHFARRGSTWPPLNLAYIAAMALKAGHTVQVIDGEAESLSADAIIDKTESFGPGLIGITATTPFYHIACELAKGMKERMPKATLAIGGHHVTVLREKAFFSCFDIAFIGEAEKSWVDFLDTFERQGDLSAVKGLLLRKGDETIFTGAAEIFHDQDALPFPARHLLRNDLYKIGTLKGVKKFTTIMGSRGCPFGCIFCSTKVFGREVRKRSPAKVAEEIRQVIATLGIRHFMFLDDTLTLDRAFILSLCETVIRENLCITFEGSTRANLVDEELIATMAKAGLIRLSFGLETADESIRKTIKKEVPLADYIAANRLTNSYGIETLNSCIIGLPGETRATIRKTLDFLRTARDVKQSNVSIAVPYPGTELYEMAKRRDHGLKLMTEDFSQYRRYNAAVMQVGDLSPDELIRLQNDAFLSIYSRPWRILPMLKKHGLAGGLLTLSRIIKKMFINFLNPGKNGAHEHT